MLVAALPCPVRRLLAAGALLLTQLPAGAQRVPVPGLPHFAWQNPLPTGFVLNDLHAFSPHSALVVGDGGTALRTSDRGRTWQRLATGTHNNLLKVSFGDSLHGWVAYNTPYTNPNTQYYHGRGEVRYTADGGRTWTVQALGTTHATYTIKSLQALSATEAYVSYEYKTCVINQPCGGVPLQALRHTTDGGRTWALVTAAYPQVFEPDLQFVTPQTAYLTGGNIATVLRSQNGGLTWRNVAPDSSGRVLYDQLCFVSPQHGWLSAYVPNGTGQEPNLYYTRNGGRSWTPRLAFGSPPFTNYQVLNLAFADTLNGIVVYRSFTDLRAIATHDGGQTWSTPVRFPSYYHALRLLADGSVWASGLWRFNNVGDASVGHSPNFGATWTTPFPSFTQAALQREPQFFGATRGWVIPSGDTVVLTTDRRGSPWRRVPLTGGGVNWRGSHSLSTGDFVDADTGYVHVQDYDPLFAVRHAVLKTTDGGRSWARQVLPLTNVPLLTVDLRFATARRGALVGSGGRILVTQDGGQTWQQPPSGTRQVLFRIAWLDSLTALVLGDSAVQVRTRDGGRTWQASPPVATGNRSRAAFLRFFTPQRGYKGGEGEIQQTTDGGQTWTLARLADELAGGIPMPIPASLTSGALVGRQRGLAFGYNAWGRTTDGGQSWQRLATLKDDNGLPLAEMGTAVDAYNAWAVGPGGRILHYSEKFLRADTSLARLSYCAGESFALAFDTVGAFSTAEQDFRVELSNAMGRFRPGQTTLVGQGSRSPLAVTLPATLPAGTRYRVRVIRADSSVLGGDNEHDLTIWPRPAAVAVTPADSARVCAGDSVQLTAPAGYGQYQWSTGATTAGIWVRAAGTYTVQVAAGAGCYGPASAPVVVRLTPRPSAPTITAAPQASGIVVLTSSAPTGNQWFLGGNPLSGATGASYAVTTGAQSGTYTVQVTQRGCASPLSAPQAVTVTGLAAEQAGAALTLTPNPSSEVVSVTLTGGSGIGEITITDVTGRRVLFLGVNRATGTLSVPVHTLPGGTYLLRAKLTDGRSLTRRLLINR